MQPDRLGKIARRALRMAMEHPEMTVKEMAREMQCSRSYLWKLNHDLCLGINIRQSTKLSDDEREGVRKRYQQGWTISQIAVYYGTSYWTVERVSKSVGRRNHRWTAKDDMMVAKMFAEGQTCQDVADAMGLKENKIKSRRFYIWHRYDCNPWKDIVMIMEHEQG